MTCETMSWSEAISSSVFWISVNVAWVAYLYYDYKKDKLK